MSGHVFHPGHEALHGVTVVVRGRSGRHYIGRYHETTDRGVVLHDVATHDPSGGQPVGDWIARQRRFGVAVEERFRMVPLDEAEVVVRLVEWEPPK